MPAPLDLLHGTLQSGRGLMSIAERKGGCSGNIQEH
jgi:hypothetical protein